MLERRKRKEQNVLQWCKEKQKKKNTRLLLICVTYCDVKLPVTFPSRGPSNYLCAVALVLAQLSQPPAGVKSLGSARDKIIVKRAVQFEFHSLHTSKYKLYRRDIATISQSMWYRTRWLCCGTLSRRYYCGSTCQGPASR